MKSSGSVVASIGWDPNMEGKGSVEGNGRGSTERGSVERDMKGHSGAQYEGMEDEGWTQPHHVAHLSQLCWGGC